MRTTLLAFLLLAGCGSRDQAGGNEASATESAPGLETAAGLTGLYEGGNAAQPDQLCMIEEEKRVRFGLVVWGANDHSCLGAGEAVREGDRLRLTMAGDSTCRFDARIEGGKIVLPAEMPEGCSYYCGARARFAARTLTRKGADEASARKATDLAGDPLC